MRYVSVFSGIGGLEHSSIRPLLFCEQDAAAAQVLARTYAGCDVHRSIEALQVVRADCVAGGWPCQDVTVAGQMKGMRGERSGLFFQMVEYAVRCGATTVVGENVPNLLRIRGGADFRLVLRALQDAGFRWVAWRTLDAREFGLPQARRRVIFVASKDPRIARCLHRSIIDVDRHLAPPSPKGGRRAAGLSWGFYWTGGLGRSLCLREGVVPALKVGSSTSKGTSPVGIYFDGAVRKLTALECLQVQGFYKFSPFADQIEGDTFRMAGNAVPLPIGHFAMRCASDPVDVEFDSYEARRLPDSGISLDDKIVEVRHQTTHTYFPLPWFLESHARELSPQACAGLLARVIRGERKIPLEMFDALYRRSRTRTSLIGTRINSFDVLDTQLDAPRYRRWIESTDGPRAEE